MRNLIFLFIFAYIFWLIASYFIYQIDNAKVYLNDCFETPMKTCTTHSGKLKRTFFKQDYIITENGKDIYIKKNEVHSTSWSSKN